MLGGPIGGAGDCCIAEESVAELREHSQGHMNSRPTQGVDIGQVVFEQEVQAANAQNDWGAVRLRTEPAPVTAEDGSVRLTMGLAWRVVS